MRWVTCESPERAAIAAAEHIAARITEGVAARGTFSLALSGGRTPRPMIAHLAGVPLPWGAVLVVQVDERVAPRGDAARNDATIREALGPTGARLLAIDVEDGPPERSAEAYARVLSDALGPAPILDLVHLGLGAEGHTASLFPDEPAARRAAAEVVATAAHAGHRRVTLTARCLRRARERVWLVTGPDKRAALSALAKGHGFAASLARAQDLVFTDEVRDDE